MQASRQARPGSEKRGAIMILFVVLFPLLILMVGFSIDFAYMQQTRTELRRATDLAAQAAALSLSDGASGVIARQLAIDIAAENFVAGAPMILAPRDIDFGTSIQRADGVFQFVEGGRPVNSVRVIGDRTLGSASGAVDTYFGALYDSPTFEPKLFATAAFVNSDICLVLDRSSSMKRLATDDSTGTPPESCELPTPDSRWAALASSVNSFIDVMNASRSREKVAVVTFGSDFDRCSVTYPATTVDQGLTTNLTLIRNAMTARSNLVWEGRTDIAAGIEEGQRVLTSLDARDTAHKIMIVMTDGRHTTAGDPVVQAQFAALEAITIYTITFSPGASQSGMIAVADAGNGVHYHADDASDLDAVFRSLGGAISKLVQ